MSLMRDGGENVFVHSEKSQDGETSSLGGPTLNDCYHKDAYDKFD